jgi:hypothetical protein
MNQEQTQHIPIPRRNSKPKTPISSPKQQVIISKSPKQIQDAFNGLNYII